MGAIIIRADQKSSKLLKELAVQLGAVVTNVKDEHYEDFMLGIYIPLKVSHPFRLKVSH
jgi:hypothetical protein